MNGNDKYLIICETDNNRNCVVSYFKCSSLNSILSLHANVFFDLFSIASPNFSHISKSIHQYFNSFGYMIHSQIQISRDYGGRFICSLSKVDQQ